MGCDLVRPSFAAVHRVQLEGLHVSVGWCAHTTLPCFKQKIHVGHISFSLQPGEAGTLVIAFLQKRQSGEARSL